MKRDREAGKEESSSSSMAKTSSSSSYIEKGKMWVDEEKPEISGGGMDELLAVLGYKVRSSDLAEVAQQLEQLDMAMGTTMEDGISYLSTDTVHYNPSDLSGWVQNMLAELNTTGVNNLDMQIVNGRAGQTTLINDGFISFSNGKEIGNDGVIYDDDLRAIPGGAVLCCNNGNKENELVRGHELGNDNTNKRMRSLSSAMGSDFTAGNLSCSNRQVVLVDSQETGIRLVHTLMACAEAVQRDDMKLADALVKHIGILAVSQAGAMRKVATYFAEALARRIYKIYPQDSLGMSYNDVLEMHFYETCPYLKFAHFTANQAILEAFVGVDRVHVIDFTLKQGMQWPALMQALALRAGGPPVFKLTGIGPPQPDNNDSLQEVGWKLAQLANTIGVKFEFKGFVAKSLADLDASILDIKPSDVEAVAVNSIFELHKLLGRTNAIEKVLNSIKSMKPKIVTIVEQEANHNGGLFQDRFNEALHYYSTMFDSLESSSESTQPSSEDLVMSEVYLGRQICNVLACEGVDRVERHELLTQWRDRMNLAGFDPVSLGSNAYKQASMLLALFGGGDGYRVEENDGCLMLGWHTRPLIATSAWQVRPN